MCEAVRSMMLLLYTNHTPAKLQKIYIPRAFMTQKNANRKEVNSFWLTRVIWDYGCSPATLPVPAGGTTGFAVVFSYIYSEPSLFTPTQMVLGLPSGPVCPLTESW